MEQSESTVGTDGRLLKSSLPPLRLSTPSLPRPGAMEEPDPHDRPQCVSVRGMQRGGMLCCKCELVESDWVRGAGKEPVDWNKNWLSVLHSTTQSLFCFLTRLPLLLFLP